jgi:transcriptional regulator with XRE-family HTH domain
MTKTKEAEQGKRLEQVRVNEGFKTQKQFAALIGEDPANYNRMESGTRALSNRVKDLLVKKLGYSYEWLMDGKGDMKPEKTMALKKRVKDLEQKVNNLQQEVTELKETLRKLLPKKGKKL